MLGFIKRKTASQDDVNKLTKQLNTIEKVSSLLISGLPLETSLTEIAHVIPGVLGVSLVAILVWDENKKQLRLLKTSIPRIAEVFVEKATGSKINEIIYPTSDPANIFTKAIETKTIQSITKVEDSLVPLMSENSAARLVRIIRSEIASLVVVPMTVNNRVLGILALGWKEAEISNSDYGVLTTFSNQAAIAVYNASLYEKIQQQLLDLEDRNVQHEAISKFTNRIISVLDIAELPQVALNTISEILGYITTAYFAFDKENKRLVTTAYSQNTITQRGINILPKAPEEYIFDLDDPDIQDTILIRAFKEEKIVYSDNINDIAKKVVSPVIMRAVQGIMKVKSFVAVPVKSKSEIVAIICFMIQNRTPDELSQIDINTMDILANQIGIAFDNAKLYGEAQKALNELETKYREERDMIGILGHELRTPLTVAIGNAELILKKLKEYNQELDKEYLSSKIERIFDSILKERDIVETALSTSRIDNNKITLQISKFDIRDIVNYAISAYTPDAVEKKLKLELNLPDSIPHNITTDAGKLQEIVNNLISNAIKYTHEGCIKVTLNSDQANIYINVEDTGEGIPADEIPKLGQKFYRINQHLDKENDVVRAGGTGLGLYVVKSYLTIMGGELRVTSELGKGSTFTAVVPIEKEGLGDSKMADTASIMNNADMFVQMGLGR